MQITQRQSHHTLFRQSWLLLIIAAILIGGGTQHANALEPGDEVSIDAITAATWIQGEKPKAWEKDKVYMLECWATWCGPCIRVIPHVNELHAKYADKGLVIIGMNVWEDGKEKVETFVKDKGDEMSYNVAYVGKGGQFEKDYLEAAGVRGIPHAFLVKNGKLLLSTHPARINEKLIEDVLAGGDAQAKAVEKITSAAKMQSQIRPLLRAYQKAGKAGDAQAMAKAIAKLEKLQPNAPYLTGMKIEKATVAGNWDSATDLVKQLDDSSSSRRLLPMLAMRALAAGGDNARKDAFPQAFRQAVTDKLASQMTDGKADAFTCVVLANMQWSLDQKDAAKATAATAVASPGRFPVGPFEAFAKSLEDGQPQTPRQVMRAVQIELRKARQEKADR